MDLDINLFNINHNQAKPNKGVCLISEPFSPDSYFGRSIVLLTEHHETEGSVGYIINKPVDIQLNELFPDFPPFPAQCYLGGPVNPETIHYLHTRPDILPSSNQVLDNIYWGGDFDNLRVQIEQGHISPKEIKFYLGYSGWAPEQLKQEIDEKFWIVTKIAAEKIMHADKNIWKKVLKEMGDSYALWADAPLNPAMN
jgi:putative transcriptional regulator